MRNPSAVNCSYAATTTPRETPRSCANTRDDGRTALGPSRPERDMSRRTASICDRNVPPPRSMDTRISGAILVLFACGLLGLAIGPTIAVSQGTVIEIKACSATDFHDIYAVCNDAARAYRGVIPADQWKEPYMPESELRHEIAAGVRFFGAFDNDLVGVMGIQDVCDVSLIRHANIRS